MKKIKNILYFLIMVCVLTTGISSVSAAPDKKVTFRKRNLNGVSQYSFANTSYKYVKTSNGNQISFCIDLSKSAPADKAVLTLGKKIESDKYVYILSHGSGGTWDSANLGKNFTEDQQFYITQVAIWLTQGSIKESALNSNSKFKKPIMALYNAAQKYKAVDPSISVSAGGNMALSADGQNYVSQAMKLGGSGYSSATVTLVNAPADARIVVDGNAQASGSKVAAGKSFTVSIPASKVGGNMAITVKVAASATKYSAYRYSSGNSSDQRVAMLYKEPVTLNASTTTSVNPTGSLVITKVDNSNGTEVKLSGATIVVKNSAGAVVATWTTNDTNNPYTINNLPLGTYTIIEQTAPAGYVKASDVNVTTVAGRPVEVKLTNTKNPSKVKISKQDATTKAELPGAHLVLKDAMGKVVDEWTSTTTPHYIQTLTPGAYTLTETIAPEGYLVSSETVNFIVEKDGGVEKTVVMYNNPIPDNTLVKVSKRDITNEKEIPGATLVIKDASGKIIDQWVSTTQPHYVSDLPQGKYTLIETQSPAGYGISDEVVEFEVTADGGVEKTVVMYNSPIPKTADINLTLVLVGLVGTIGLAGFSIFKLNKQQA